MSLTAEQFTALGVLASAHVGVMTNVPLAVNSSEIGDGTEDINDFDLGTEFSWNTWMTLAINRLRAQSVMLTAKHVDGMTMWPSVVTSGHSIQDTAWYTANGNRDLFGEFVDEGRARGVSVGAYLAVGDSWLFLERGSTFDATYVNTIKSQLTEILAYELDYVLLDAWGDSWGSGSAPDFTDIPYTTLRDHITSVDAACLVIVNDHDDDYGDIRAHETPFDGERKSGYTTKPVVFWKPLQNTNQWFGHSDTPAADLHPNVEQSVLCQHRAILRDYTVMHNFSPGPDGTVHSSIAAIINEMYLASVPTIHTGLQNHWKLDAASGNESDSACVTMYSTTPTLLTAVNAPGTETGKIDTARTFNGTTQNFACTDSAISTSPLAIGNRSFTFVGWGKFTSGAFAAIFSKDHNSGTLTEYLLSIDTSAGAVPQWRMSWDGTNYTNFDWTGNITVGQYFHFAVGHDATNNLGFIQINGGTRVSGAYNAAGVAESIAPFNLAARDTTGIRLAGAVDDLRLYMDRVWTSDEVITDYNAGVGTAVVEYTHASQTTDVLRGRPLSTGIGIGV